MFASELFTILTVFNATLHQYGYEAHPFAVRCYNDIKSMKPSFRLKYSRNTLALTVVAAPDMFEKALIPCICKSNVTVLLDGDPTDNCNQKYFKKFFAIYPETDFLSSYKMLGPGHPLVLSQTAAHVSGAAYYYQRRDVPRDTWPANKTIYGVAIHPLYGGWVRFPEYRVHVFRLFAPIVEIITGTSVILDSLLSLTNCQERNFPSKICTNCGQPPLNIMDNHDEYYT
ncbi:Hypothetical predicted protein [Octopus vulgaris]|uniref:Cyanocobalamin reductase (cyanide-eliminating) n=1 Tax=Octopus vulgaris TaxID=6645 RepID=A0AA36F631_OCTVU|nr:Hypothetical predicted protein [Octopus vulgaris]